MPKTTDYTTIQGFSAQRVLLMDHGGEVEKDLEKLDSRWKRRVKTENSERKRQKMAWAYRPAELILYSFHCTSLTQNLLGICEYRQNGLPQTVVDVRHPREAQPPQLVPVLGQELIDRIIREIVRAVQVQRHLQKTNSQRTCPTQAFRVGTRLLGFPDSIQAFKTLSLKPLSWPALRKRRPGRRVSISIRDSVERSVAVMSSSCREHFSHSTCMRYSLWRPANVFRGLEKVFLCVTG